MTDTPGDTMNGTLTQAASTALHLRALTLAATTPHTPEHHAAADALVALVSELVADSFDAGRREALSEMLVAVELVKAPAADKAVA